jgi:hypothetical protein
VWARLAPGWGAAHDSKKWSGFAPETLQRRVVVNEPRKTYRPWNPDSIRQQTHSPLSKLPEGDLVFFLLEVVPQLDLSASYAP